MNKIGSSPLSGDLAYLNKFEQGQGCKEAASDAYLVFVFLARYSSHPQPRKSQHHISFQREEVYPYAMLYCSSLHAVLLA